LLGEQRGAQVHTELGPLPAVVDDVAGRGPVDVMLRPHEVTFTSDPDGDARVAAREFRGASYLYTLQLASGARVRSVRPHTVEHGVGTPVRVDVEAGHPVRSFVRAAA
jgi:iron(III) transport system ATP-binding protein